MHWEFNIGWFLGGIAISIIGLLMIKFHRAIADNLFGGMSSYDKVKIAGIIAIVLGFIIMCNLHSIILYFIFHLILPNQFP